MGRVCLVVSKLYVLSCEQNGILANLEESIYKAKGSAETFLLYRKQTYHLVSTSIYMRPYPMLLISWMRRLWFLQLKENVASVREGTLLS